MDTIKQMHGRIEAKTRAARNLLAEVGSGKWTAVQQAVYDDLLDDVERTKELLEARASAGESPIKAWAGQRSDLDSFIRLSSHTRISNTMSTTTGSQGGYAVGPLVANDIISRLAGYGWMRQVATQITTTSGAPMSYPTSDGTTEVGERMLENATATTADPIFGAAALPTTKYGSRFITVPIELLQDSKVDLIDFIMQRATDRIGRLQNLDFTVGTGTQQPTGLVTAASVGKLGATGQAATIIYADLADMVDSVDEACLGMPSKQAGVPARQGTGWMFSQTMRKMIRRMVDGNGRPIWLPGIGGELPQLLDYPVHINNDMPVPAAGAKSLAFGALSRYAVRDALEVTLYRFEDSSLLMRGCVGFMAVARSGGNLLDTGAVKLYQHPTS